MWPRTAFTLKLLISGSVYTNVFNSLNGPIRYREAGAEVINVLMQFSKKVERASIDEAFIDLTDEVEARLSQMGEHPISLEMLPCTHVAGWQDEKSAQDDEREEECEGNERPPKSKEGNAKYIKLSVIESAKAKVPIAVYLLYFTP